MDGTNYPGLLLVTAPRSRAGRGSEELMGATAGICHPGNCASSASCIRALGMIGKRWGGSDPLVPNFLANNLVGVGNQGQRDRPEGSWEMKEEENETRE